MAGILADEQRAGRLQIAPARIVCTAEVLTPELRRRIEAVWGEIVFNQYGATEGGTFAVECERHRGLHLFEDLVILEVVDEQNRLVPPGTYGDKILLTVLFNYTQPLIRYELSDSVCISPDACPCGSAYTLMEAIQGRREEVLSFRTRDATTAVHPMVFYRILDAEPVLGWQVVQEENRLRLCLHGDAGRVREADLIARVQAALARQEIITPRIVVEWEHDVTRGATGKVSRIVSRLSDPPARASAAR
jgi:phenylacetate-coenzyme A ligase PaaK-like adenylate-forming protein